MSPTQPLPPKKDVALALLERSSVYIHLDPRPTSVAVPTWFKSKPQLVLQIGLNMPVPIPDLRLDDSGITCTLSFNRSPFFCVVPWGSVFAMVGDDGRGMVWPDDVPAEVARQAQGQVVGEGAQKEAPKSAGARESKADAPKAKRTRKRPVLAAVSNAGEKQTGDKAAKPVRTAAEAPPRVSHGSVPRPAVAPGPPAGRPGTGISRKRKKELPPYLRVVK